MSIKNGKNDIVFKTKSSSLEEAKEYFRKLKQMTKEDFNKFQDALNGTLGHVKDELLPDVDFSEFDREYEQDKSEE